MAIDRKALGKQLRKKLRAQGYKNLPSADELGRIEETAAALPSQPRSSLQGRRFRVAGFTFQRNPYREGWFLQMCIYQALGDGGPLDEFVLTVSEGPGNGDVPRALDGLGKEVPGSAVAPFAARHLSGISLPRVRELLEKDSHWYWVDTYLT